MVAWPGEIPVITPFELTVATSESEEMNRGVSEVVAGFNSYLIYFLSPRLTSTFPFFPPTISLILTAGGVTEILHFNVATVRKPSFTLTVITASPTSFAVIRPSLSSVFLQRQPKNHWT